MLQIHYFGISFRTKLETLSQSFQQLKQQKIQQQEEFEAHQQELIAQFTSQLTDQVLVVGGCSGMWCDQLMVLSWNA